MRLPIASWYPAHPSNQTAGRGGNVVDRITIHHTAANNTTLRHLWADPARNGSSHFFVSDKVIEQYVDTVNTAWTNGNFASNQRSISIEVNGDWRNGYYNQGALNNLQRLLTELRRLFPNARIAYHMDESSKATACPADLKHKGYALDVWNKSLTQGGNMPTIITEAHIGILRIAHSEIGGWDLNEVHAGVHDAKFLAAWKGRSVDDLIWAQWNHVNAQIYRNQREANKSKILELQTALANEKAKPPREIVKEIEKIVEKPVEVEKIVEKNPSWLDTAINFVRSVLKIK